jgi:hypothetical protein
MFKSENSVAAKSALTVMENVFTSKSVGITLNDVF